MDRRALSFLALGLLLGILISVSGFSWYVRGRGGSTPGERDRWVLKLAHGLDQGHPVNLAMEFMARRVAEESGGRVEIQVFPNGQLGGETSCLEQVQRGALDMTKSSTGPLESFVPCLAVFSLPYVFRDDKHCWRVLDGPLGARLLQAGTSRGLRGLCYYDAGARSFYTTRRPILRPDDLTAMKIRTQKSETAMSMVEALGATPTPIAWGELYTALQQGMVDGAENNLPSFYSNRHFEVCKHFSLDEHTRVPDMLVINTTVWNALPSQVQQWLQSAADESSRYQRRLWAEKNAAALQAIQNEGVTVYYPDKAAFIQKVQPMLRQYQGTEVGDLLAQIREAR